MVLWFVGLTNRSARDFIVQTETLWPRVRLKSYHEWITMDHYRLLIFPTVFSQCHRHVQYMAVYHFFYQVNDEAEMAEGDMATLKALPHLKVGGREDSN